MSNDSTPEICKRYADVWIEYKGPADDWDKDMPWVSDMASARQKSFEIASGSWVGWIDGDDRLAGPEEAEKLLKLNDRWKPNGAQKTIPGKEEPESLEDLIRKLEDIHPNADCVYAPYLYQKTEDGKALVWQTRERIVRWDAKRWGWREEAHEILVPIDGRFPPRVDFPHLLFVHEKEFTQEANHYSLSRHFDVLHRQYMAGDITERRCEYLAMYAELSGSALARAERVARRDVPLRFGFDPDPAPPA